MIFFLNFIRNFLINFKKSMVLLLLLLRKALNKEIVNFFSLKRSEDYVKTAQSSNK